MILLFYVWGSIITGKKWWYLLTGGSLLRPDSLFLSNIYCNKSRGPRLIRTSVSRTLSKLLVTRCLGTKLKKVILNSWTLLLLRLCSVGFRGLKGGYDPPEFKQTRHLIDPFKYFLCLRDLFKSSQLDSFLVVIRFRRLSFRRVFKHRPSS